MQSTLVRSVMTPNPTVIQPESSLKQAAVCMETIDCGVLPVGTEDNVEGIITDRDIVIRAVASGKDVTREKVEDYMTPDPCYCNEDDTLEKAANLMRQYQVNRLLVQDANGNLSGIVTFGCMLRKDKDPEELSEIVQCAVGKKAA